MSSRRSGMETANVALSRSAVADSVSRRPLSSNVTGPLHCPAKDPDSTSRGSDGETRWMSSTCTRRSTLASWRPPRRSADTCTAVVVGPWTLTAGWSRSEEHTSELQSRQYLVCRLLLEKKKKKQQ